MICSAIWAWDLSEIAHMPDIYFLPTFLLIIRIHVFLISTLDMLFLTILNLYAKYCLFKAISINLSLIGLF